jgi:hypothetical protein
MVEQDNFNVLLISALAKIDDLHILKPAPR